MALVVQATQPEGVSSPLNSNFCQEVWKSKLECGTHPLVHESKSKIYLHPSSSCSPPLTTSLDNPAYSLKDFRELSENRLSVDPCSSSASSTTFLSTGVLQPLVQKLENLPVEILLHICEVGILSEQDRLHLFHSCRRLYALRDSFHWTIRNPPASLTFFNHQTHLFPRFLYIHLGKYLNEPEPNEFFHPNNFPAIVKTRLWMLLVQAVRSDHVNLVRYMLEKDQQFDSVFLFSPCSYHYGRSSSVAFSSKISLASSKQPLVSLLSSPLCPTSSFSSSSSSSSLSSSFSCISPSSSLPRCRCTFYPSFSRNVSCCQLVNKNMTRLAVEAIRAGSWKALPVLLSLAHQVICRIIETEQSFSHAMDSDRDMSSKLTLDSSEQDVNGGEEASRVTCPMDLGRILTSAAVPGGNERGLEMILQYLFSNSQGRPDHFGNQLVHDAMTEALVAACRDKSSSKSVSILLSHCHVHDMDAASMSAFGDDVQGRFVSLSADFVKKALRVACEAGHPEAVALLVGWISSDVALDYLTLCVETGCWESFKHLVSSLSSGNGGSLPWASDQLQNVLWEASRFSRWEFVLHLLVACPPPNGVSSMAEVLICAARDGQGQVLEALGRWTEQVMCNSIETDPCVVVSMESDGIGALTVDVMCAAIKASRVCGHEGLLISSLSPFSTISSLLALATQRVMGKTWMGIPSK